MARSGDAGDEVDVASIIRTLSDHRVRYVVIGGMAAILQDVPIARTLDFDLTPARGRENLDRLAAALRDMDATLRVPGLDEGVEIPLDGRTFRNMVTMTFNTSHGALDVSLRPDGTEGYVDLAKGATTLERFGVEVRVASVRDIIRSKEAAARPKDAEHLPVLYRFLREIEG